MIRWSTRRIPGPGLFARKWYNDLGNIQYLFTYRVPAVILTPQPKGSYEGKQLDYGAPTKLKRHCKKHVCFFASKLAKRGYSSHATLTRINAQLSKLRARAPKRKNTTKSFFGGLKYSGSVPIRDIKSCFKRHSHLLHQVFRNKTEAGVAFALQKSLFQEHFRGILNGETHGWGSLVNMVNFQFWVCSL